MTTLAVTVVGDDRPGITAAVTGALAEAGCNLEDTSCTILRGHFAMMLVVEAPGGREPVEQSLAPVAERLVLEAHVREVAALPDRATGGAPHLLTLHGADRPGIVSAVSALLARHGGNVTDLTTRLAGRLYVLTVELDLPSDADPEALSTELAALARELGVEARLQPADADVL